MEVEAQLYADPNASVAALDEVSYGLGRGQSEDYLVQIREQGLVGSGPREVVSRRITRAKGDDPPTFIVKQCLDMSQVEVTKNGEPFEGPSTERNLTTYGISFWEDRWQVSFIKLSGPNQC